MAMKLEFDSNVLAITRCKCGELSYISTWSSGDLCEKCAKAAPSDLAGEMQFFIDMKKIEKRYEKEDINNIW